MEWTKNAGDDRGGHLPVGDSSVELIGGEEHRPIVMAPYDQSWPALYEVQRQRIVEALGGGALRIEHVGSTAVSGLSAKPVIDIQLSVADVEDEAAYVPQLEAAGYVLRVRGPGHRMLRTPDLTVHVHVCDADSAWERRHLLFRDWLRNDDADRARYQAEKLKLAAQDWPTMNHYADAKSTAIKEIMAHAERWASAGGWPEAVK